MVFVNEKGFLRKKYEVLFDAPYNEVDKVDLAGRFQIDLLHNNKTHKIETSDISARVVVAGIEKALG